MAVPFPECMTGFFFLFETGSCYVHQAGLQFMIILPQPPTRWDYRGAPSPGFMSFYRAHILLFWYYQSFNASVL
jgi:hypothetical protein